MLNRQCVCMCMGGCGDVCEELCCGALIKCGICQFDADTSEDSHNHLGEHWHQKKAEKRNCIQDRLYVF